MTYNIYQQNDIHSNTRKSGAGSFMHGLFNYDGLFVQTTNKIVDCICLSLLWLVSSLPVVTVGAATTALYYAMNKCVRRSEGGVWSTFWHSFRMNFRQATGLWLMLLLFYGLMLASCCCAWLMYTIGSLPKWMPIVLLVLTGVITLWAVWLFPYLARFTDTVPQVLKNCALIAVMNFPKALLQFAALLISLAVVLLLPLGILFIPGVYMVLSCYIAEPAFLKYMSPEDRAREEALLRSEN